MKKFNKWIIDHYIILFNLYFISIFLKSTTLTIDYPFINTVQKIVRCIAFAFMMYRLILLLPDYIMLLKCKKWKEKTRFEKLVVSTITMLLFGEIINFILYRNIRLVSITLVIISAYKVDYKKIIKNMLIMQLIMTCITVASSIFGITQNFTIPRENGLLRYSLGFAFTTNLSQIILFSTIIYIYTNKFKVSNVNLLFMQVLNLFVYYITNSKTELVMFEIVFILTILYNSKWNVIINKTKEKISKLFVHHFILLPILSLILVLLYGNNWNIINKANKMMSNRLAQTYEVVSDENVKVFGSNIELVGYGIGDIIKYNGEVKSNYIDNEYLQILVINGIIVDVGVVILINILLYCLWYNKTYKEFCIVMIYLIFGLLNPRIIDLMYSPVLFLISDFVIKTIKEKDELNGK